MAAWINQKHSAEIVEHKTFTVYTQQVTEGILAATSIMACAQLTLHAFLKQKQDGLRQYLHSQQD